MSNKVKPEDQEGPVADLEPKKRRSAGRGNTAKQREPKGACSQIITCCRGISSALHFNIWNSQIKVIGGRPGLVGIASAMWSAFDC